MRIETITANCAEGAVQLTAPLTEGVPDRPAVYFRYEVPEAGFVRVAAEAMAAATLLPAMRADRPLAVDGAISPRLCFNLPRIRDIFHCWWPEFRRVALTLQPAADVSDRRGTGAATFFSGGVDSFYSLLKYRSGAFSLPVPLTHLIFFRGVETRLERTRGIDGTEQWMRDIASEAGVGFVTGETNVRTSLQSPEDRVHWERHYHGSALAAVALPLSPAFAFVCIPSAFSYRRLIAHGSTPLVDEMYSTEALQIVHDGSEVSRPEKVARILEWHGDLVLRRLRVCIRNRGGAYNCGHCYKCVRTAIPLHVLGVWDRATTFRNKDTSHWESVVANDHEALIEENLRFAIDRGGSRALVAALKRALRRRRRYASVKTLVNRAGLQSGLVLAKELGSQITRLARH
jgi:hypothetical protein